MSINLAGYIISIREIVLGLLGLVACYILFVLWRVRRVQQRRKPPREPVMADTPVEPEGGPESPPPEVDSAATSPAQAWQEAQARMAQEAFMRGVEREQQQLREELDALRGELAALREELRQEVHHMRAAQTISPIYSDAMQMATVGHDASTIAERCGIARAEAELVVSLVQSQKEG